MPHIVRFGSYEADLDSGQLRKRGVRIRLRYQLFQVLDLLLEHPGQVISRGDFQRRLWDDGVSVDFENNLNTAVAQLRQLLGDSAERPAFIETLPKRGYRFIADVQELPQPAAIPAAKPLRLVVLPFVNLTGDSTQEYLSDAMTDEIITALAPLSPDRIAVIARTTAMHYKGSRKDVAHIGHELAVDYAIEGAVRRSNLKSELNIQVVRARDETHIFGRKYEALSGELFELTGRVAADLAVCFGIVPTGSPMPLTTAARTSRDLVAYSEYIQGRSLQMAGLGDFNLAQRYFESAIARDSEFVQAHDALAEIYWYLGYLGFMSPRKAFSMGIMYALHALEIDNTRAETHALLGQFHKAIEYNWPEVHREMSLAIRLDSNSPIVLTRYAVSDLMPHGRLNEAIAALERALEFDPLSPWARFWLGIVLMLSRRYDDAINHAHKLLELSPSTVLGNFVLGVSYGYLGKSEAAIAALKKVVEYTNAVPSMVGWLGMVLARFGHAIEARALLGQLHERANAGYVPSTSFAWIHLGLNELDPAFEFMDRAVEECDQLMMPIKTYGFMDPFRTDPRYAALLRKMRLAS